MTDTNAQYIADVLRNAKGAKLADILVDADEYGDAWLGLVFEKGRKHKTQWVVWVSRDPEGNGPGWLDVLKRESKNAPDGNIESIPFGEPTQDQRMAQMLARSRKNRVAS